jgi:hypothetical protein
MIRYALTKLLARGPHILRGIPTLPHVLAWGRKCGSPCLDERGRDCLRRAFPRYSLVYSLAVDQRARWRFPALAGPFLFLAILSPHLKPSV